MKTDNQGIVHSELQEFAVADKEKSPRTEFTVVVGEKKVKVNLNKNQEINIKI